MTVTQQLAEWAMMDAFAMLPKEQQTKELEDRYRTQASEMLNHCKSLLQHPRVHSVNVHDLDACRRTLDTMVQSDSLPKKNSLEGLLLLREAWSELDVANFLASKYKFQTKAGAMSTSLAYSMCLELRTSLSAEFLYFSQLLFAWLVVLTSQMEVWQERFRPHILDPLRIYPLRLQISCLSSPCSVEL